MLANMWKIRLFYILFGTKAGFEQSKRVLMDSNEGNRIYVYFISV